MAFSAFRFFQVGRCRDDAALGGADAPRCKIRIHEPANANGHIDALFHQVHEAVCESHAEFSEKKNGNEKPGDPPHPIWAERREWIRNQCE